MGVSAGVMPRPGRMASSRLENVVMMRISFVAKGLEWRDRSRRSVMPTVGVATVAVPVHLTWVLAA